MAGEYWSELTERFGAGWNRFWFEPSDPLPLCAMRPLVGLVAWLLVFSYTPDLVRLFGPEGLLPIELVNQLRGDDWTSFSYFNHLHTPAELQMVHYVGLAVVGLFTVGLFTRVTAVLSLIVVLSYIHRAPMLTGQVEPIAAMLLAYLCLGPSGAYLSVDRWLKRRRTKSMAAGAAEDYLAVVPSMWATLAVRLVQVHLCVIYLMMGLAKLSGPNQTWWEGDSVWWLAARPGTRLVDLTDVLARHEYLVNAWTHLIPAFELAFPILVWNRLARPLLLVLAVPIWLSLALVSGLPLFCSLMLIGNLAFVSPAAWRACCGRGN
jgi:hypothetical protein